MQYNSECNDDEVITVKNLEEKPKSKCSAEREFSERLAIRPDDVTHTNSDLQRDVDVSSIKKDFIHQKNNRKFLSNTENEQRESTVMRGEEHEDIQIEGDGSVSSSSSCEMGVPFVQTPQHQLVHRPRLTLSAFRMPAERLVDFDKDRSLAKEYELSSIIGHGATSTVRLARRKSDGTQVAIKYIAKHDMLRSRVKASHVPEWEVLDKLKCNPYIVDLLDTYETDEQIQMVMEYCDGGELYRHIEKHDSLGSESYTARVGFQMLTALNDLHSHTIVHRDVKPENILLTSSNHFKLCDFGLARSLCNGNDGDASPMSPYLRSRAYSTVGSDFYTAPEVSSREGYGTPVDIYSLGVTLYVLLCGFSPHDSENIFSGFAWSSVTQECKALLRKMLDPSPASRITAQEALQDPWILLPRTKRKMSPELFSPSKPRPVVDLELVRSRLCVEEDNSSKRRRLADEMEQFISEVADFAAAAASGVNVYSDDTVEVLAEEDDVAVLQFETASTATTLYSM